jgi:hypothetical protein
MLESQPHRDFAMKAETLDPDILLIILAVIIKGIGL